MYIKTAKCKVEHKAYKSTPKKKKKNHEHLIPKPFFFFG